MYFFRPQEQMSDEVLTPSQWVTLERIDRAQITPYQKAILEFLYRRGQSEEETEISVSPQDVHLLLQILQLEAFRPFSASVNLSSSTLGGIQMDWQTNGIYHRGLVSAGIFTLWEHGDHHFYTLNMFAEFCHHC